MDSRPRRSSEPANERPRKGTGRTGKFMAAGLLVVAAAFGALALAASSFGATSSRPEGNAAIACQVNFQASSLRLPIGRNLVLTWAAMGADKLTASWTTGFVPLVGAVTTTMHRPGTYSYQVAGSLDGVYCGGASVHVSFTGSQPTQVTTSAPPGGSPATSATPGNGGSGSGAGGAGAGGGSSASAGGSAGAGVGGTATSRHAHGRYPAQSPTGGTGVPWFRVPVNLLAVSALALLGSIALWRREVLGVALVHRH